MKYEPLAVATIIILYSATSPAWSFVTPKTCAEARRNQAEFEQKLRSSKGPTDELAVKRMREVTEQLCSLYDQKPPQEPSAAIEPAPVWEAPAVRPIPRSEAEGCGSDQCRRANELAEFFLENEQTKFGALEQQINDTIAMLTALSKDVRSTSDGYLLATAGKELVLSVDIVVNGLELIFPDVKGEPSGKWKLAKKALDLAKKRKEREKLVEAARKISEDPFSVESMVAVGEVLPVVKKGLKIYKDFAEIAADSRQSQQDLAAFAQQTRALLAAVKKEQRRLRHSRMRYEISAGLAAAVKQVCNCNEQQPLKLGPLE